MPRVVINKKPVDSDTHTYLDYVEILALLNMDGSATIDSAVDRYFDSPGDGRGDPQQHESLGEEDSEGEVVAPVERRVRSARVQARFSDAMALASWRMIVYGADYPFEIAFAGAGLQLRRELSDRHLLYLFILVAANLPFVAAGRKQVTDTFEAVSHAALFSLMPKGSEAHVFGQASATRYSGSAYEKMLALCRDIRARMTVSEADFRSSDTGDSGVDLVSWFGMSDEQPNIVVCLGQCACSRSEWTKKQLAASPMALSYVSLPGGWSTAIFVPICFRRVGGGWAVATEVASVIFVDRLRLMKNVSMENLSCMSAIRAMIVEVRGSEEIV